MMVTFSLYVRLMRFFGCRKIAQPMCFAADSYACAPFVLEKYNTHKSRLVSAIRFSDVFRISSLVHYAKIAQAIVMFVAVYMVNKAVRPFAVRKQPRQPVRLVNFSAIADSNICRGKIARDVVRLNRFGNSFAPRQKSRFRAVAKDGLKMVYVHVFNVYPKTTGSQA
jgi:hypothetical protein